MKSKKPVGLFCETYGDSLQNRVLEFLLENQSLDVALQDIVSELGLELSRVKQLIKEFQQRGYVKKSRICKGTQLFCINKANKEVKQFLSEFHTCLATLTHEKRKVSVTSNPSIGVAFTRNT